MQSVRYIPFKLAQCKISVLKYVNIFMLLIDANNYKYCNCDNFEISGGNFPVNPLSQRFLFCILI